MSRHLPLLRSKPESRQREDDARRLGANEARVSQPLEPKRVAVKVACDRCRERKIRCDGRQPICRGCNSSRADCHYTTDAGGKLRNDLKDHKALFQYLRDASEEEALVMIRRMKDNTKMSDLLKSLKAPSPPRQPSSHLYARALLPQTQSSFEYELTMLYSVVYPALEPIESLNISLDSIGQGKQPLLPNFVAEKSSASHLLHRDADVHVIDPLILTADPTRLIGERLPESTPSAARSQPSSKWCDPRLGQICIGYWTRVVVSNDFAAGAISTYLETDHALLGFFDADLFLSDLLEQRLDYCSPFLVSSLLCLACLCYTGIDKRAAALSRAFQREAEHLWHAYRGADTTTTLSAALILAIASTWLGQDDIGKALLADSRAMAERLQLFGSPKTDALQAHFLGMTPPRLQATSHVAWGCFCYVTFHATMYGGKSVPYPPILPIPGKHNREVAGAGCTSWPPHPTSDYMGGTFTALCELWAIVQEVLALYNAPRDGSLADMVPLSFAEEKYRKLLSWAGTFTRELARHSHNLLHVQIFHAMYHVTILNIFRPFLETLGSYRLRTFASSQSSPNAVVYASFQQLERLLIEVVKQPNYKVQSALLNPAVMHISNIILAHYDHQKWRHKFLLCMSFWIDAIPSFPVLADIALGYLSLGSLSGNVSTDEAQKLRRILARVSRESETHKVSSSVIIDFDRAATSGDMYRAYEIAQKFEDHEMFNEFVHSSTGQATDDIRSE